MQKSSISIRYFIILFIVGALIIIFMPTYETPYEKYNKLKYQGKWYIGNNDYYKAIEFFAKSSKLASKEFYHTDFNKYLKKIKDINAYISNIAYNKNINIESFNNNKKNIYSNKTLEYEILEKINRINNLMFSKKMILEDFMSLAFCLYKRNNYSIGEKYFIISYIIDNKNPYVYYLGALLEFKKNRKLSKKLYDKGSNMKLTADLPMFSIYDYIISEMRGKFEDK